MGLNWELWVNTRTKGTRMFKKDAQHQTPGAEISQQKQEGAQEQKPQVPPEGVVLLVSPLEKDGDNRYKNDIRKAKEQVDGTKCCEKKRMMGNAFRNARVNV